MQTLTTSPVLAPVVTKPTIYLNYFGGIDLASANAIMGICSKLVNQHKPDELYFLFSSPGGSVSAGVSLYHFLRALPVTITMHNTGSIDSIANVIFAAGDKRYASPQSSFMFHGVATSAIKDSVFSVNQLTELKSSLEHDQRKIAGIMQEQTKLTEAEIVSLFNQGEAKSPQFAMEKGIVSDILAPSISAGAMLVAINING